MVRAGLRSGKHPCRSGKLTPDDLAGPALPHAPRIGEHRDEQQPAPAFGVGDGVGVGAMSGDCVEVATHPAAVHVRDSKVTDGPVLTVPPHAWSAFLDATV